MSNVTKAVSRNDIQVLEDTMREMPQVHMEPTHRFATGLYSREITIPKGTLLVGKIHNFDHINIISKGHITVVTEDGLQEIKAPHTMVSRPGTKRVGFAHEETVWTTVHACTETDIEKVEKELVKDSSYNDLSQKEIDMLREVKCLS